MIPIYLRSLYQKERSEGKKIARRKEDRKKRKDGEGHIGKREKQKEDRNVSEY
jgi:hypothetical protein